MKIVNYVKERIRNSELESLYEVIITIVVSVIAIIIIGFLFAATVTLVEKLI
tara:strand:+ start:62 stop:217 length:156 start_codon:yes stop_codon:yes gene_type:complete